MRCILGSVALRTACTSFGGETDPLLPDEVDDEERDCEEEVIRFAGRMS